MRGSTPERRASLWSKFGIRQILRTTILPHIKGCRRQVLQPPIEVFCGPILAPMRQSHSEVPPFFVLLFNHGWAGRRTQDTFLTEDLASHGYVVAAIDHTYNSVRVALPGDRIVDNTNGYDPLDASKHTAAEIEGDLEQGTQKMG